METQGMKITRLNKELVDNFTIKPFKEWNQSVDYDSYKGFLLGIVYQTYGKLLTLNNDYELYGNRIIGSLRLAKLSQLVDYLLGKGINPVYYVSSIVRHIQYKHINFGSKLELPQAEYLKSFEDIFTKQSLYDNQYIDTGNTRSHETILYRNNPVIEVVNNFFDRIIYNIDISDSYKSDYLINYDYYKDLVSSPNFSQIVKSESVRNGILSRANTLNNNKYKLPPEVFLSSVRANRASLEGTMQLYPLGIELDSTVMKILVDRFSWDNDLKKLKDADMDPNELLNLKSISLGEINCTTDKTDPLDFVKKYWYTYVGFDTLITICQSFKEYVLLEGGKIAIG